VRTNEALEPADLIKEILNQELDSRQRLEAAQKLSGLGTRGFHHPDAKADSRIRNYTVETETVRGRTLVHVFATDGRGKKHVVLRGIHTGDGKFEKERDAHGHRVAYQGDWWSQYMVAEQRGRKTRVAGR